VIFEMQNVSKITICKSKSADIPLTVFFFLILLQNIPPVGEKGGQIFIVDKFASTLSIILEICLPSFSFSRNRFLPWHTVL